MMCCLSRVWASLAACVIHKRLWQHGAKPERSLALAVRYVCAAKRERVSQHRLSLLPNSGAAEHNIDRQLTQVARSYG
eukprot:3538974-Pleurochrysis_carterae.AAC.2